jgi:hypothetical protein
LCSEQLCHAPLTAACLCALQLECNGAAVVAAYGWLMAAKDQLACDATAPFRAEIRALADSEGGGDSEAYFGRCEEITQPAIEYFETVFGTELQVSEPSTLRLSNTAS